MESNCQRCWTFIFLMVKARFHEAPSPATNRSSRYRFPLYLTSGRVVSHFLSGNQTRRIGLNDQCPEPYIEIHPQTAAKYGIEDGAWATLTSRRGTVTLARFGRAHHSSRHGICALSLGRATLN